MSDKKNSIIKKIKLIKEIYSDYLQKLNILKTKQDEIINEFNQELDKKSVEAIKQDLN